MGTKNIKLDNLAMLLWSCSKSCLRFVCFSRSQTWAMCGKKLRLKIEIKFQKSNGIMFVCFDWLKTWASNDGNRKEKNHQQFFVLPFQHCIALVQLKCIISYKIWIVRVSFYFLEKWIFHFETFFAILILKKIFLSFFVLSAAGNNKIIFEDWQVFVPCYQRVILHLLPRQLKKETQKVNDRSSPNHAKQP